MVPLGSDVASNLALFGTPWGGGARGARGVEERRMGDGETRINNLEDKYTIPWFTAQNDQQQAINRITDHFP